jgi:hypothetical protein
MKCHDEARDWCRRTDALHRGNITISASFSDGSADEATLRRTDPLLSADQAHFLEGEPFLALLIPVPGS